MKADGNNYPLWGKHTPFTEKELSPPPDASNEDKIQARSRERTGFVVAAATLPVCIAFGLSLLEARLMTLAEAGRSVELVVDEAGPAHDITRYHFTMDGRLFEGSLGRSLAPFESGERREGRALPEDPRFNRPYGPARIYREAADKHAMSQLISIVLMWICLSSALFCHWDLWRLRRELIHPPSRARQRFNRWRNVALSLAPALTPFVVWFGVSLLRGAAATPAELEAALVLLLLAQAVYVLAFTSPRLRRYFAARRG